MINGKRVLAVIPARGGSKGVPRKNIRLVAGKPLLAYTVDAASKSRFIDDVTVSSEDAETLSTASSLGVTGLLRPAELARDDTPGVDPVLHAIDCYPEAEYVVLLQPTSPMRSVADIDGAIELCLASNAPACVSICMADIPPSRMFVIEQGNRLHRIVPGEVPNRRQDVSPAYVVNGAVYVAQTEWLRQRKQFVTAETVAYLMPQERSLDIDTELDMQWFEFLLHCSRATLA